MTRSKIMSKPFFPCKRALPTGSFLAKLKDGTLFGYVQCNLVVPDKLKSKFVNGYQIMDRSRHTITKYLNDKKTHKEIHEPLFKSLNTVQKDLHEVELLKSTIEQREAIIVGFFILYYAKMRMLELL